MGRNRKRWALLPSLLLICIVFPLNGCWVQMPYEVGGQLEEPIDLPQLPIVYSVSMPYSTRVDSLWFMDANGQNRTSVETTGTTGVRALRPIFTDVQPQCVFTNTTPPYWFATIRDGESLRYHDDFESVPLFLAREYSAIYDSPYVIVAKESSQGEYHLYTVDFDTQMLVADYLLPRQTDYPAIVYDLGVNAQHGNNIVYTRIYFYPVYTELVLRDIEKDTERILGRYDGYIVKDASISPDGMQIAFYDDRQGIVMADITSDVFSPELLVATYFNDSIEEYSDFSPAPSWSPDGEWIVYHRQLDSSISYASSGVENCAIYKANVITKEEVLLVEGGLHPFWRFDLGEDVE